MGAPMRKRMLHGTHGTNVSGDASQAYTAARRHGHAKGASYSMHNAPNTPRSESAQRF